MIKTTKKDKKYFEVNCHFAYFVQADDVKDAIKRGQWLMDNDIAAYKMGLRHSVYWRATPKILK